MSASRDDRGCVELLYWEHQIPVLAPDDVAVFQFERAELARVKVLVVLRMRMLTDELTDVHNLSGLIAKRQLYRQVAGIRRIGYV